MTLLISGIRNGRESATDSNFLHLYVSKSSLGDTLVELAEQTVTSGHREGRRRPATAPGPARDTGRATSLERAGGERDRSDDVRRVVVGWRGDRVGARLSVPGVRA